MDAFYNRTLASQYNAAIMMLENAVNASPDALWDAPSRFWYTAFHTLFYLDLYLRGSIEGFRPPEPFGLTEFEPDGTMPDRVFSKDELRGYIEHCRAVVGEVTDSLTDERAREICVFPWRSLSFFELQLYNIRHVQHHVGQLNLILRQEADIGLKWVAAG